MAFCALAIAAVATATDCVPVCSAVPAAEGSTEGEEAPVCIPLCGPEDAEASPGSCARPEDIASRPESPQDPSAGDTSGDPTVTEPEQGPADTDPETESQSSDGA